MKQVIMEEKLYDPTIVEKAYASTITSKNKDLKELYKRILANRKRPEKEIIEKGLLAKLEITTPTKKEHKLCKTYSIKLREEIITTKEQQHYQKLLDASEEVRNERVKILVELADLRKVSLPSLMKMEDIKVPAYLYEGWE